MYVCMYVHTNVCTYVYVYIYICIFTHISIYSLYNNFLTELPEEFCRLPRLQLAFLSNNRLVESRARALSPSLPLSLFLSSSLPPSLPLSLSLSDTYTHMHIRT